MNDDYNRLDSSISLALPSSIEALIAHTGRPIGIPQQSLPSYEAGGLIGQGGLPIRPDGRPDYAAMPQDYESLKQAVMNIAQDSPEVVARVRAGIDAGVRSGEIDLNEINMISQAAMTALQNPEMYPQMRKSAIDRGLLSETDLPAEMDIGQVAALAIVAQSMGEGVQLEGENGGALTPQAAPVSGSGEVPIAAHEGEYVIPRDIVARVGTKFLDELIEKNRAEQTTKN